MYTIKGDPVPLARARHSQYKVYNTQKDLRIYQHIELERQVKRKPYDSMPLIMIVTFFMPISKSLSKKRQEELVGMPHFYKPDNSNLIKWIEDIGTALIYHDDCLIYKTIAQKIYDRNPRTEFILMTYAEELEHGLQNLPK